LLKNIDESITAPDLPKPKESPEKLAARKALENMSFDDMVK
jgi:hypothetical protein